MLEKYYVRPATVDRIRRSWIAPSIERYVESLDSHGFSARTILRRVPLLVSFGEYAQSHGATAVSDLPEHVESFAQQWLAQHTTRRHSTSARKKIADEARNPVRGMLRLVISDYQGRGRPFKPDNPFEQQAPEFFDFLADEKGLRNSTIDGYRTYLRQFATYLERAGVRELEVLTPTLLRSFITDYGARIGWEHLRNACGTVRVFLRYLYRQGVLANDLSVHVEFPQSYRYATIPRAISWEQVEQVLSAVDLRCPTGKRDYAMLLLLATYGLRGCEVSSLTLDDIDWRQERLTIRERKSGNTTTYPLSVVAGEALIDYLKNGRPKSSVREVFLRALAPFEPVTSAAVSCRAKHYLHRAGIQVARPGSHTLRHSCVQRLVNANFSLKEIGDYIGHRSAASTQIYAKVAVEQLRELACGDGEDVL